MADGLTWSLRPHATEDIRVRTGWPVAGVTEWAWSGSTGAGARVCILDSGVEPDHPDVTPLAASYAVRTDSGGRSRVIEVPGGDSCGHGTACAGIVRRVAPDCEIVSVQVLDGAVGGGEVLVAGLRWAVEEGFDVVNLSLSTTRPAYAASLRDLADRAYFGRTLLVASAHNARVESYPWRFSSVLSVGSHAEPDQDLHYYNPAPPVEFFGPGVNVTVPWQGGIRLQCSGNSFATPYISGLCALILSKHPTLTPFEVKHLLYLAARNVGSHDNAG
jgi:subtilisin